MYLLFINIIILVVLITCAKGEARYTRTIEGNELAPGTVELIKTNETLGHGLHVSTIKEKVKEGNRCYRFNGDRVKISIQPDNTFIPVHNFNKRGVNSTVGNKLAGYKHKNIYQEKISQGIIAGPGPILCIDNYR